MGSTCGCHEAKVSGTVALLLPSFWRWKEKLATIMGANNDEQN